MNSHLTAISRTTLPAPVRWLLGQGMVHGHVLDYGCGKCKVLNDRLLATHPGVDSVASYDPHFQPVLPNDHQPFDVILCTYVLCTVAEEEQTKILQEIKNALDPAGVAYITVRNDTPRGGYGVSSRGTFQRRVELPFLFKLRETPGYRIFLLTNGSQIE